MSNRPHHSEPGIQRGLATTRMQWLVAGIVILLLLAAYWYFSSGAGPGGAPGKAPPTSKEAVPEVAREVISEQQQAQTPDYVAALEQARSLRAEGKLADAQLLYFFAARGGYAPAAYELAELYDPLHFDASTSLMKEPDPFQAFKWYRQASQSGVTEAAARIEALHGWAKQAAEEGNLDAEQLLLQWD
jgi:TPR repeat protein